MATMMVFVNRAGGVEAVAHEDVAWYTVGEGMLRVKFADNSETVYAAGVWREFDFSPEEL